MTGRSTKRCWRKCGVWLFSWVVGSLTWVESSDHSGLFYGRHMFSKEIYYQRFYSNTDQSLSLEHLEELAQQNMRDQYNINLI